MAHKKLTQREKRQIRIRKKISGTAEKPRLSVFRSNKYLYVQLIDDLAQKTLIAANTVKEEKGDNKEAAKWVGKSIAEKAIKVNINNVVFDRSGYRYHGVIKEIADAAREGGLKF
jgi:large subunit ribosomal protein L18